MSRRSVLLAATSLCLACPAGTGKPTGPASAADAALRIRIAQAEARRAGGVDELADLAAHGARRERLLALRGLGRIGATAGTTATAALVAALGDADVAQPRHAGRGGHPPLIRRALWPQLAACGEHPDGARGVLRAARVVTVDVDDPGVVRDVDTPADLEAGA